MRLISFWFDFESNFLLTIHSRSQNLFQSRISTPLKFDLRSEWYIVSWHLLSHAIKSVICFDLPFSRSTRPMTSFCIFITYIDAEAVFLKLEDYKMRSKQVRLNWTNSMQVKKLLFTNVLFTWSFCLWNLY